MVVYGEGRYRCPTTATSGPLPAPRPTSRRALRAALPVCGLPLEPASIGEDAPTEPRSVYAATKLHQEHLCGLFAREHPEVGVTMLRYHNVYGPRMPRDTPYAASPASSAARSPR